MHKCVACQRNYQVYWHPWQAARMDLPLFARPLFGPLNLLKDKQTRCLKKFFKNTTRQSSASIEPSLRRCPVQKIITYCFVSLMHKCVACQRNYQVYWHPWQAARMDLPLFARPLFGPRSVALIIVHRILMYLQGRQHTKQYVMIFCTGHRLRDGSMLAEDCRVVLFNLICTFVLSFRNKILKIFICKHYNNRNHLFLHVTRSSR
jgi:hypothetical protein